MEIYTTNFYILSSSSFLPQKTTPTKPVSFQGWKEREEPEPGPARSLLLSSQQKNTSLLRTSHMKMPKEKKSVRKRGLGGS